MDLWPFLLCTSMVKKTIVLFSRFLKKKLIVDCGTWNSTWDPLEMQNMKTKHWCHFYTNGWTAGGVLWCYIRLCLLH